MVLDERFANYRFIGLFSSCQHGLTSLPAASITVPPYLFLWLGAPFRSVFGAHLVLAIAVVVGGILIVGVSSAHDCQT